VSISVSGRGLFVIEIPALSAFFLSPLMHTYLIGFGNVVLRSRYKYQLTQMDPRDALRHAYTTVHKYDEQGWF